MSDLSQRAIDAALKQNWEDAISINKEIIESDPQNVEALNRLGFALIEHGDFKEAKETYEKVLEFNKFNQIALKNLKRISFAKEARAKAKGQANGVQAKRFSGLFLEETGKTKVINLINLAEAQILLTLHATDEVKLIPRRRGVTVTTVNDEYVGQLPDDVARRLFMLMQGGNQYEAYIKSVDRKDISVFVRETFRSPALRNEASFLGRNTSTNYFPDVKLVPNYEDRPDVSSTEDEDLSDDGALPPVEDEDEA